MVVGALVAQEVAEWTQALQLVGEHSPRSKALLLAGWQISFSSQLMIHQGAELSNGRGKAPCLRSVERNAKRCNEVIFQAA